ncbi:nuclear transport factor 2 family protein [Erythrobacter sp. THAF29]|uniref:nuclear transport factor 2 family protein n=1 Tax=Erythrobacter sp. THAF29 TaxID=2587851 RepID=UPI0012695C05|nr:nuclear transport factor 2 family protein [Erythrobacter sp. THAF29]QFT78819.1 hypothetical protein FIU90_14810 [Erythrobacter sp. THAF29]
MRGLAIIAGLLAALPAYAPASAQLTVTPREEAVAAADTFFAALRSENKAALAEVMIPEAVIFVHNHMDAENPRVSIVPVSEHLKRWANRTAQFDERMIYSEVMISGDMAHVWGPYAFWVEGEITHCGINSLSLVKQDGMWKVGNTSFTMEDPDLCPVLGAPMLRGGIGQ